MVHLTVNGRAVAVPEGTTLLEAARQAGVHVPTLCYHPRLPAQAVCRMCLVEVQGQPRPVPACNTSRLKFCAGSSTAPFCRCSSC